MKARKGETMHTLWETSPTPVPISPTRMDADNYIRVLDSLYTEVLKEADDPIRTRLEARAIVYDGITSLCKAEPYAMMEHLYLVPSGLPAALWLALLYAMDNVMELVPPSTARCLVLLDSVSLHRYGPLNYAKASCISDMLCRNNPHAEELTITDTAQNVLTDSAAQIVRTRKEKLDALVVIGGDEIPVWVIKKSLGKLSDTHTLLIYINLLYDGPAAMKKYGRVIVCSGFSDKILNKLRTYITRA